MKLHLLKSIAMITSDQMDTSVDCGETLLVPCQQGVAALRPGSKQWFGADQSYVVVVSSPASNLSCCNWPSDPGGQHWARVDMLAVTCGHAETRLISEYDTRSIVICSYHPLMAPLQTQPSLLWCPQHPTHGTVNLYSNWHPSVKHNDGRCRCGRVL